MPWIGWTLICATNFQWNKIINNNSRIDGEREKQYGRLSIGNNRYANLPYNWRAEQKKLDIVLMETGWYTPRDGIVFWF